MPQPELHGTIQSRNAQGRVKDAPSGHWVYRLLPPSLWPYAQLARWDRPIGWQLLLWPCWWSTALVAGAGARSGEGAWAVLPSIWHLVLFFVGAVAMRGAGCTYNDLVDQEIDDKVDRTRSRPLPSGQVTRKQAKIFILIQALIGLAVLLQFNWFTVGLGIFSLVIVAAYPFMKRITDWPQLVLGLALRAGYLTFDRRFGVSLLKFLVAGGVLAVVFWLTVRLAGGYLAQLSAFRDEAMLLVLMIVGIVVYGVTVLALFGRSGLRALIRA